MEPAVRPKLAVVTGGDDFDRLKSLLFRPEAQRLERIETDVSALDGRVGTRDRLESATAEVLVEALKRAEVAQHRELSQAIAPVVVAAIRNEIKNSKDMMVEALYPITGRLVTAGIAVAMAELTASINARMDSLLSVKGLQMRLQAWRTGRPLSELAIAQAQRGRLVRLLHLERGSGVLTDQWQAGDLPDDRADLIGGMIAALTDFARSAMGEGGGELRTLDMGGAKIYLRTSAQMIVAAEYAGFLQPGQERALDSGFLELLETGGSLDALAQKLSALPEDQASARRRFSPLFVIGLLLLAGLAWLAFSSYRHWRQESRVAAALAGHVARHPALAAYPVGIETLHGEARVQLRGLVPDVSERTALEDGLRAAALPYALSSAIAVVGTRQDVEAMVAAQRALEARATRLEGDLQAQSDRIAREAVAGAGEMRRQLSGMEAKLSGAIENRGADLAREIDAAKIAQQDKFAGADAQMRAEIARQSQAQSAALAGAVAGAAVLDARSTQAVAALRLQLAGVETKLSEEMQNRAATLARDIEAAKRVQQERLAGVDVQMTGMRTALATQAQSQSDGLAGAVSAAAAQMAELRAELKGTRDSLSDDLAATQARLAATQARLDAPVARLAEELRGFAVFFQDIDTVLDETAVREKLARVVPLAGAAGGVRVTGHADETGTPARNRIVSRQRAEAVARLLAEAGMDRQKIVIVSQANATPLADKIDGNGLRNRRATLEPLFASELPAAGDAPQ